MPSQMPPAEQQLLARAVRRLRMERGMNLRQAADMLDLDFTMLSRLENGKRGFRQVRRPALTAERIAEAFGVTVEEVRRPCPRCCYAPPAGYICGRCGTSGSEAAESETVVNYVVEGRLSGKPWLNLNGSEDEGWARVAYGGWLTTRGSLEIQLVKRTSVITDEVLESGQQGGAS